MSDHMRSVQGLQEKLHQDIPVTRHLGVQVVGYDGRTLRLDAPLEENINHKSTAFGGSLNSLVMLAGWSMVWVVLRELGIDGEIVIQDGQCKFLVPVKKDFTAYCERPDEGSVKRFARMLRTHKKARLELKSEIFEDDNLAVSFHGRYVVILKE